jgi:multidrug transporter EmrE-like cation transporter
MRTGTFALIMASVTLSALAQASFKVGLSSNGLGPASTDTSSFVTIIMTLAKPAILSGFLLYGLGTLLWLQVLSRTDLSQAYPFVGIGFIMTAVLGVFLFGEAITAMRASGISLVILGIYLIARS